jgi:hypothetical protein
MITPLRPNNIDFFNAVVGTVVLDGASKYRVTASKRGVATTR